MSSVGTPVSSTPVVGIKNIGNSCYMSAVLQLLRCCDLKEKWIWNDPVSIRNKIGKQFNNFRQHDAHEFLLAALEHIDLDDAGTIESTVHCKISQEVSTVNEKFHVLSLPVTSSLTNSIIKFQQEEQLLDGWLSPKMIKNEIAKNTPTFKSIVVNDFPKNTVIIHLKRFHFNIRPHKNSSEMSIPLKFIKNSKIWKLHAFVYHSGAYGGGHYVSFVFKNEKWYLCDDFNVRQVDIQKIEKYASRAYLFLYKYLK